MSRRNFLIAGGVGLVGAGAVAWWQRNTVVRGALTGRVNEGVNLTAAAGFDDPICTMTPEQAEGPFFFKAPNRQDIREDRTGVQLDLNLRIVKADGCTPVQDAAVEIWHCDAAGRYSGYPEDLARDPLGTLMLVGGPDGHVEQTNSKTFLRGVQTSDADGYLAFRTILPGWYEPRVPHIHVKVFVDGTSYTTTQLYFEEALTQGVYTSHQDYQPYGLSPYNFGNDTVLGGNPEADGLLLQPMDSNGNLTATCRLAIA